MRRRRSSGAKSLLKSPLAKRTSAPARKLRMVVEVTHEREALNLFAILGKNLQAQAGRNSRELAALAQRAMEARHVLLDRHLDAAEAGEVRRLRLRVE